MKDAGIALLGALIGAVVALSLLFVLPTQVSTDHDRCVEVRTMYEYDSPPPCWVAVLTVD